MDTNNDYYNISSKINKEDTSIYEIIESSATFPNDLFLKQVKHEMEYYNIDSEQLAKSTYISNFRLGFLLSGSGIIEQHEIDKIRNRLHF